MCFLKILLNFSNRPATYGRPWSSVFHFLPKGVLCYAFWMIWQRSISGHTWPHVWNAVLMFVNSLFFHCVLEKTLWVRKWSIWITQVCALVYGLPVDFEGYHPYHETPHNPKRGNFYPSYSPWWNWCSLHLCAKCKPPIFEFLFWPMRHPHIWTSGWQSPLLHLLHVEVCDDRGTGEPS